jgi:hypothetical protein
VHKGACTSGPRRDETKVTGVGGWLCQPPPACVEEVCRGKAAGGYQACVVHDGDVACPGAPWTNRAVVGSAAALGCEGCGACESNVSCGTGVLHYFAVAGCQATTATRVADGSCANVMAPSGEAFPIASYRYERAMTATCQAAAGHGPITRFAVEGTRTVCCR